MSEFERQLGLSPHTIELERRLEIVRELELRSASFMLHVPRAEAEQFVAEARAKETEPGWRVVSGTFPDEGPCQWNGCQQTGLNIRGTDCECPKVYVCGEHLAPDWHHDDHNCSAACCLSGHTLDIPEENFFATIPEVEVWIDEEPPHEDCESTSTFEVSYSYMSEPERRVRAKQLFADHQNGEEVIETRLFLAIEKIGEELEQFLKSYPRHQDAQEVASIMASPRDIIDTQAIDDIYWQLRRYRASRIETADPYILAIVDSFITQYAFSTKTINPGQLVVDGLLLNNTHARKQQSAGK